MADFATKTYLFFYIIHLFKNIRNNLLNQKKFVFSSFQFDLFHDGVHVPDGYISWRIFHKVHERDENLQVHRRKAHKTTYQVTHPTNIKQSVPLTLAITLQENTTITIKIRFLIDWILRTSWRFFIKFSLFAILNNVSVHQTNLAMQQFKEITNKNSFFLWQTGLKHGQNFHHLPNKLLMLLWQRLDALLIWLMTCSMKTTITYLRQDSIVIQYNVISVNISRWVADVS